MKATRYLRNRPIFACVVDKAGYEKILFRPLLEIDIDRISIVEFGEADAGMRTARADNDRKLCPGGNFGE